MSARVLGSNFGEMSPEDAIAYFASRPQIKIYLPFLPPTLNHYLGQATGGRKYKTQEAVKFDTDVFYICSRKSIMAERLRCEMHFYFKKGRRGRKSDIDNRVKPLWDSLVKAGVMKDDSLIDEFTVRRMSGDLDCTIVWLEAI